MSHSAGIVSAAAARSNDTDAASSCATHCSTRYTSLSTWKLLSFHPGYLPRNRASSSASTGVARTYAPSSCAPCSRSFHDVCASSSRMFAGTASSKRASASSGVYWNLTRSSPGAALPPPRAGAAAGAGRAPGAARAPPRMGGRAGDAGARGTAAGFGAAGFAGDARLAGGADGAARGAAGAGGRGARGAAGFGAAAAGFGPATGADGGAAALPLARTVAQLASSRTLVFLMSSSASMYACIGRSPTSLSSVPSPVAAGSRTSPLPSPSASVSSLAHVLTSAPDGGVAVVCRHRVRKRIAPALTAGFLCDATPSSGSSTSDQCPARKSASSVLATTSATAGLRSLSFSSTTGRIVR